MVGGRSIPNHLCNSKSTKASHQYKTSIGTRGTEAKKVKTPHTSFSFSFHFHFRCSRTRSNFYHSRATIARATSNGFQLLVLRTLRPASLPSAVAAAAARGSPLFPRIGTAAAAATSEKVALPYRSRRDSSEKKAAEKDQEINCQSSFQGQSNTALAKKSRKSHGS